MSHTARIRHFVVSVVCLAVLLLVGVIVYPRLRAYLEPPEAKVHDRGSALFELIGEQTLKLSPEAVAAINLQAAGVEPASAPDPLRLPGYLMIDPNRLVPVHSRFPGEVVQIGQIEAPGDDGQPYRRPIRYGDKVKAGQLLAVVWSTDIGQKKSELVDALSKLQLDEQVWEQLKTAGKEVVAGRQIIEAARNVEADKIARNTARRALVSWRLTEEEIAAVEREAKQLHEEERQTAAARNWSELEIRTPMEGVVVEKNVNVGEIVDTTDNLFKVADLSTIQVLAYVFEEDLPFIERMPSEQRIWHIDLKSDPHDPARPGTFKLIGSVIDQTLRTAPIIGWLDNADDKLRANQFVTATIELPADPTMVSVPTSALIEEGSTAAVFVETNPKEHEVTRRVVAVTRRGEKSVFIRSEPSPDERAAGAQPLRVEERVVSSGGLELDSELANLQSAGAQGAADSGD